MKRLRYGGILTAAAVLALFIGGGHCAAETKAGKPIRNTASATYADPRGKTYTTQSNTVQATVAEVSSLAVSPDETVPNPSTDSVPLGQTTDRVYTITNTSNITDAYEITSVKLTAGKLLRLSFVSSSAPQPITIGQTISGSIRPGDSIKVDAKIGTAGLSVGQIGSLTVTAQTTVTGTENGVQHDNGEQWIVVVAGPSLNGPNGTNSAIQKSVDHQPSVQSASGSQVTFDVVAQNSGGAPAMNVVVKDVVPKGLSPNAGSVKINGVAAGSAATVNGQTVVAHIAQLDVASKLDVAFTATVINAALLGATFVNTATVSADGVPPSTTTPASVLIGTADVVYDGYGGSGMPISGASVALLDASGAPVKIHGSENPVLTGTDGVYGLPLPVSRVPSGGIRLYLIATAPGYLNRRIQLDITPGMQKLLYNVRATAVDGQSLATAGGYTLVAGPVRILNVLGLFGNIPMFSAQSLNVSKSVDRQVAQPGDRLMYTVTFANPSRAPLRGVSVVDQMPQGILYAPGTAKVDGLAQEPMARGNTLQWNFATLPVGGNHTIVYAGVVYPNAPPNANLSNLVTVRGTAGPTGRVQSASATASVQVIAGTFTQRSVITGRVFVDSGGTGHFRRGDKPLANVRIYLEDGSSVLTDSEGKFSFPSVRPGAHVLRLDASTLPNNVHAFTSAYPNSTRSLQRLVHGLLDDGLMQDVNFALEGTP